MKKLITLLLVGTLCGCASIWSGVITVTQVRDSAMKELAQINKAGKMSVETFEKVNKADLAYRQAAELAARTLESAKVTGDQTQYIAALNATKTAVLGIIQLLTPLAPQQTSLNLQSQLAKASQL